MTTLQQPYADTPLAKYLNKMIDRSSKSQREIANEIGYDKPNVLSMYKTGASKVPFEKIPLLAKALGVDPGYMMKLAIAQVGPGFAEAVEATLGAMVTKNERAIIEYIRVVGDERDPALSDGLKAVLAEYLKSLPTQEGQPPRVADAKPAAPQMSVIADVLDAEQHSEPRKARRATVNQK